MSDRPTFLELLDKLTADHPVWVNRESGNNLMTQTGLLQQLREAVFSGMENTGGGASFGSKPPMDAGAQDLLNEITVQASEVLAAVSHQPTPYGHVESYVRLWAGQTTDSALFSVSTRTTDHGISELEAHRLEVTRVYTATAQYSAYNLLAEWVARIEGFFNPPSTREIKAPCPVCEVQYTYRTKDGETVKSPSFNFIRDETGTTIEAKCSACGSSWSPDKFGWLAEHVGVKSDEPIRG